MNKITHTFTYDLPDDYLAQTNILGKVATWTYNGPDKIWIFLDKETNKIVGNFLTEDDKGGEIPVPLDQYRIEIDPTVDPIIATLVGADELPDYATLEQYTEELPCGNTYTRPLCPPPDHTYELLDITYDVENSTFVTPLPWKQPHITWDGIRQWRNHLLDGSDYNELPDMPAAVLSNWVAYRQGLRDLPQTYGASSGSTIPPVDPWKIQPINPPN
jgi:hypothetical protein